MNPHTALPRLGLLLTTLAGLCLAACSTTTLASSWKDPTAKPLGLKGQNVAAVVMIDDMDRRKPAEDMLASEITHYGAKGIPMYVIMPEGKAGNEAAARAALEQAQVKGVVVMRPLGVKTTVESRTDYSDPMYNSYWGGYYGHGWGNAWGAPMGRYGGGYGYGASMTISSAPQSNTTVTKVFEVEVFVYSLEQNQLVWAGRSETTERPEKLQLFVIELAAITAKELDRLDLIDN
jgi:hypothetical protein